MLSIETFKRIVKSRSERIHDGHFSQDDKGFDSIGSSSYTQDVDVENIEVERVEENNGNWHNIVHVINK